LKKKKKGLLKTIQSAFECQKAKKWSKRTFGKNFKMKLLPKNIFLLKSSIS
jgi:hypothetical protein